MALEFLTARRFVYSRLFAEFGAEHPIIELDDPFPGEYPYIAYDLSVMPDTTTVNGEVVMAKLEAVVRVVSEGGVASQAEPLRRIQRALHKPSGMPEAFTLEETSGWVQSSRRVGQMPQQKLYFEGANVPVRHNGHRYSILVQELRGAVVGP